MPSSGLGRFVGGLFRGADILRRIVLNLIFFFILGVVLWAIFKPEGPTVPKQAILTIAPKGALVEQKPNPYTRVISRFLGQTVPPVTRVQSVINALNSARHDSEIKGVALDLDDFGGGSLEQLQRVGRAIKGFEKSGKPVIAYASNFSQGAYYLASMANHIYLTNRMGMVAVVGLAAYREYYKDLLDKLKVDWNVFRVGKYKSFVEPYTRNDMSPAAKQENRVLLNQLWNRYISDVAAARGIQPDVFKQMVEAMPEALQGQGNNPANLAVKLHLVDAVKPMPEVRTVLAHVAGFKPGTGTYNQIDMSQYLDARHVAARIANRDWDQVGVIVAQGDIVPGNAPQGEIGSNTLSRLIRKAMHNPRIKAVVLDVDSPGGSGQAAEQIFNQLQALKRSGKPLVVSMAGVAASGGYWISLAGQQIFAEPTTITGSIGIFGMLPTFQRTLAWAGAHRDGVETGPLADLGDPLRSMTDPEKKAFSAIIHHGYRAFTEKVAKHRHMSLSQVDKIAQGRVWSGEDAKQKGLIDHFGGLSAAVAAAAKMAHLGSSYGITYVRQRLTPMQEFILSLANNGQADAVMSYLLGTSPTTALPRLSRFMQKQALLSLQELQDPQGIYAFCFCQELGQLH